MRKSLKVTIAITIAILALLLIYFGLTQFLNSLPFDRPSEITYSWQTVYVDNVGSFRIPLEWNVEQKNGITYITDKPINEDEYDIYCIGSTRYAYAVTYTPTEEESVTTSRQPHELLEDVVKGDSIFFTMFSMGSGFQLYEYYINGNKEERFLIEATNRQSKDVIISFELLIWDTGVIDEELAREIAKTFIIG